MCEPLGGRGTRLYRDGVPHADDAPSRHQADVYVAARDVVAHRHHDVRAQTGHARQQPLDDAPEPSGRRALAGRVVVNNYPSDARGS